MQKIIAIVGGGERATHAVLAREALKKAARAQGTEILVELRTSDGVQDPLDVLARRMSRKHRLICFDEFHVADVTARLGDDAAEDLVWSEVLAAAIPWNPLVEDPGVDVDQQEVTTARASLAELAAQIDALDSGNADRSTALDTLAEALDEQTERLERDRRRRAERAADPAPERDHDPRRSPGDDGPAPRRGGPRR